MDPAVDVAAFVAVHVDDQRVTVLLRVELVHERGHIGRHHGTQPQIADTTVTARCGAFGPTVFPIAHAQ